MARGSSVSFLIGLLLLRPSYTHASDNCSNSTQAWKRITEIASEATGIRPKLIFGSVPSDIHGTLYKNGAGRIKLSNALFYDHWFDGDGMALSLRFDGDGQIPVFSSRFIQTAKYLKQGNVTDKLLANGAWTQATEWYRNILAQPLNPSNTNLFYFANRLYSLCEGGLPVLLDQHTLHTIDNQFTFNGRLHSFFGAHPKTYYNQQLNANVMINIGVSISPPSTSFSLYVYAIKEDAEQTMLTSNSIELPYNCLVHDFMITNHYIIVLISPYIMSTANILKSVLFGLDSLGNYQEWRAEYGSYLYILDKYTLKPVTSAQHIAAISYWHWIHAFDRTEQDAVHIHAKLVAFPSDRRSELEFKMKNLFKDDAVDDIQPDLFGGLMALDITLSDNMSTAHVSTLWLNELNAEIEPFELAEVNEKYMSSPSLRYVYANSISRNGLFLDSLQKIDLLSNTSTVYSDVQSNVYLTSPAFIEREFAVQEDDGYIVCYAYNVNEHNSRIYIFNASNITQALTIMQLEFHVPILFHGTFVKHSAAVST